MSELEIEHLGQILSQVHEKCLAPFYPWSGSAVPSKYSYNWEEIPETSEDDEITTKEFFRSMARYIIDTLLSYHTVQHKREKLAEILSLIHCGGLVPFYNGMESDIPGYGIYSWEELPEVANEVGDVDKRFFRRIADYIFEIFSSLSC